ncbi:MAG: cation:proton antiporter [Deltaproteobacteria bacterium]|nr:cation:proton antiporter [Deltaproteobacteria bacterium]
MSAIALLMGLLLLSYVGSLIIGGRQAKGLPSGVEFLGLGFLVGPHALGVVERSMIHEFEPIVQVALGWLAFVVGLDFGRVNGRRVRAKAMAVGVMCALVTGGIVSFAVNQMLARVTVPGVDAKSALVLAAGAGAVAAETTRFVVQWVAARWVVKGPVSTLLVELASADDFAPFVAAGAIFAFAPSGVSVVMLPAAGWFGLSLALGALLGTVTALLLRGAEGYDVWGALVGTILLGVGTASRFGLCTIFVTFVMGIALAAVSPNRRTLRRMVSPTERAILYPMLLLAGAHIDARPLLENRMLVAVVALVLIARIAGKVLSGFLVRGFFPAARPAGPALGIVLLSSGPVSISCGFVFALRFPGRVGDTLLVCAAASAVLGELVSTFAVKSLLTDLGEVTPTSIPTPSSASGRVEAPAPPPSDPSMVPSSRGARGGAEPAP